jgi:hypothetical protein
MPFNMSQRCGQGKRVTFIFALVLTLHLALIQGTSTKIADTDLSTDGFGRVASSMVATSGRAYVLGQRNYAPRPEDYGQSNTSTQYQVSQFIRVAMHPTCSMQPYILLSTHLSIDRLSMLRDLMSTWSGCVSASVLLKKPGELQALAKFHANDPVSVSCCAQGLHF